jgi:hypothetical protein
MADEVRRAINQLAEVMQPFFDARAARLGILPRPSLAWEWPAWDEVRVEYETLLTLYGAQPEDVRGSGAAGAAQPIVARAIYRTVRYQSRDVVLAGTSDVCA